MYPCYYFILCATRGTPPALPQTLRPRWLPTCGPGGPEVEPGVQLGRQKAPRGSLDGGLPLPAALAQGRLGGQGYPQEALQEANRNQSKNT